MIPFYVVCLAFLTLPCGILAEYHVNKESSETKLSDKEIYETLCPTRFLKKEDMVHLETNYYLVKEFNVTIHPLHYDGVLHSKIPFHICFNRTEEFTHEIFRICGKVEYYDDEFEVFHNGSALILNETVLEPGMYEIIDSGSLLRCDDDNGTRWGDPYEYPEDPLINIGKYGSSVSVLALIALLVSFCLVPSLRTLPGYTLASLSVALLLGYSFNIIGQIPEVLGVSCVISGVFQLYFFLVAFFCMNVMSFDIWKTLKLATDRLVINSTSSKKKKFILYTLYSWGLPLVITIVTVIMDNVNNIPSSLRPNYGFGDLCQITNNSAKIIFFVVPSLVIFVANGIFFILSALIIKNNRMKYISDDDKQTSKTHFALYVRLGVMMGVTWVFSVVALAIENDVVWKIFELVNSLQGLFLFLFFACSNKVYKHIRDRLSMKCPRKDNEKPSTTVTKSESDPV